MVFSLGPVELGGLLGVVNLEECLLPESKVLTLKEEELVVILVFTQHAVGAGSGAGSGAFTDFFLIDMAYLGSKILLYKIEKVECSCGISPSRQRWRGGRKRGIQPDVLF